MQPQPSYPPQQQQPANPAQTAAIILGVCALALLIALVTKGWASATEGRDSVGAGPLGFAGGGESISWDKGAKLLDIPGDVSTFRILGLIAGFLAVGGYAMAAGMALSRNLQKIPVQAIATVAGVAAGTLTWFAFRLWQSDDDVNFGPSWGAFLGLGAIVTGGIVLRTMLKPLVDRAKAGMMPAQLPPAQAMPGYAPPPVAPQAGPTCPRCGGPTEYVPQYQRWFCRRDNQYV